MTNFDEAQARLTAISKWIDDYNTDKTPLEQLLTRFLKIHEERGEAAAEIIGMSGQNPRKGVTANILDVQEEALDWAVTALGVVEHINGNRGDAFRLLFKKIQDVDARRLGTLGPIASDVKIDKFLAATEDDSAVEGCGGPAHPLKENEYCPVCQPEFEARQKEMFAGLRGPGWTPDEQDRIVQNVAKAQALDMEKISGANGRSMAEIVCSRCNLDTHSCPGCGIGLPHGTEVCSICSSSATESVAPHVHTDSDLDPWTSGPNGPTRYTDGCPVSVVPPQ